MNEIIQKILEWPTIIQGLIGTALFYLILFLGQKIFIKIKGISKKERRSNLEIQRIRLEGFLADNIIEQASFIIGLIYGCLNLLIKAIIMLVLGLICQPYIPVFGTIGYLFSLIYLFRAINNVRDLKKDELGLDKQKAKLDLINKKLKEIEKET